jgi:hypothetical protein
MGNIIDGKHRRDLNEFWDKDFPSTKCDWTSWRVEEQVEVRAMSCP